MADQWNANIPTLAGQISTEYPQIEQNFGYFQQILLMLVGWHDSTLTNIPPPNIDRRSLFTYTDTDTVSIGPGVYFHDGTTRQCVFWDADIAFNFGSGGSNALSDDLTASAWHYVYLDDSAIVTQGSPELDADCFLNDTTAPTWSDAKHGWYNGSDRCIFAVITNGSSQILEFFHQMDFVYFADHVTVESGSAVGTSFADITALTMPSFSRESSLCFNFTYVDNNVGIMWRTNGQSGSTGHIAVPALDGAIARGASGVKVLTDSSHLIEIKETGSSSNTVVITQDGWFFPRGM